MPKRVTIEPHLSVEELENGYRQACEPVERTQYQIIWLLAKGMTTREVVAVTGYSRSWIYELVWGYNRIRPEIRSSTSFPCPESFSAPLGARKCLSPTIHLFYGTPKPED